MPPPQQQLRPAASHLTNAVTVREAENAFRLVEGDVLLNLHHILVEAGACPAKTESSAPSECLPGGLPLRAKRQLVKPSGRHRLGTLAGDGGAQQPRRARTPAAGEADTPLSVEWTRKGANRGETSASNKREQQARGSQPDPGAAANGKC